MSELVGKPAPAFPALRDQDDRPFDIHSLLGKDAFCLFFYPAAMTYGCTKQACSIRDVSGGPTFTKPDGTKVMQFIGVSSDTVEKQKKFAEKHGLKYTLLADTEQEARKAYNVNGTALLGISAQRVTFIVDRSGVIRASENSNVNMSAHAKLAEKWAVILANEEGK